MTTSSGLSFTTAPLSKNRAIGHEKRLGVDSVERRLFVLVVACGSVSAGGKAFFPTAIAGRPGVCQQPRRPDALNPSICFCRGTCPSALSMSAVVSHSLSSPFVALPFPDRRPHAADYCLHTTLQRPVGQNAFPRRPRRYQLGRRCTGPRRFHGRSPVSSGFSY